VSRPVGGPAALALAVLGVAAVPAAAEPGSSSSLAVVGSERPVPAAPTYDGFSELLVEEARAAMQAGDFPRAIHFYYRVLELTPDDPEALRETGRAAHALGKFEQAAAALGRAAQVNPARDPELHFLRAECLNALGRKPEAEREYAEAERQIGPTPTDRRDVIWLGRIYAVRGQTDKAEALYSRQLIRDTSRQAHTEIVMYLVEAHILANDWGGAQKILEEYLRYWPDYARGREMLAWVLEARGDIERELKVRRALLTQTEGRRDLMLAYARSLERANDYPAALAHYREVEAQGDLDVRADIQRIHYRLTPELVAAMTLMRDPSGQTLGWQAGATIALPRRWRAALVANQQFATPPDLIGLPSSEDVTLTTAMARGVYTLVTGGQLTVAAGAYYAGDGAQPTGSAGLRIRPTLWSQLALSAEVHQPWRESSSTIREGGTTDSATAEVYAAPFGPRLVFGLTGRVRRLGLAEMAGAEDHAYQLFGAAGVDVVALIDNAALTRGEILDHDLAWPSGFASALVISLRHYELGSEDPFGARLVLVENSRLDEVSGVARRVLGDGVFGAELRGGIGYDWLREVRLWRGGGSIAVSPTPNTRFSFDYDIASESGTGLTGRRHLGVMGFHVDL
jgi:tetratricopeptide (TPR) repeat protein